jgi:hypothetical protein
MANQVGGLTAVGAGLWLSSGTKSSCIDPLVIAPAGRTIICIGQKCDVPLQNRLRQPIRITGYMGRMDRMEKI